MIGEWGSPEGSQTNPQKYEAWDGQILHFVGGTYAGTYGGSNNPIKPESLHSDPVLTAGVSYLGITSSCTGFNNNYGTANGGIPLFKPAIANSWGMNVITILDSGIYDDCYWWSGDGNNARFAQNVVKWLATPILELDITPPTLTLTFADPSVLWPPNQKMVDVVIMTDASDDSGEPIELAAEVSSNEPQDGSEAYWTEPLIDPGNGIVLLQLLADRSGKGSGRVYTVTITAIDSSGNKSRPVAVEIKVPHDQRKK